MSAITASSSETKINPPSEVTIYHLEPPYDQEPVLVLKDTDLRSIGWIDADTLLLENISTFETSGGIESDSFLGGSAACVRTPGISTEILSCATGIFSAGGAAEGPVLSRVEGSIRSYSKAIASWTFVS